MSTVTLQGAEAVLKSVYLDTLCDQLNNKTSYFYNQIAKGSEEIAGKDVRFPVRAGCNGGIGSAPEAGTLPVSAGNNYLDLRAPLKNIYGTIELSDKVIRASATSAGSLVNVLSDEIEGLLESAKFNFQRMLFQDGSGLIGMTKGAVAADLKSVVVKNCQNFYEGMVLDLYATAASPDPAFSGLRVTYVQRNENNAEGTVNFEPALPSNNNIAANACFYLQQSKDQEIYGLNYLFDSSIADFYGVSRADAKAISPLTKTATAALGHETLKFMEHVEIRSGAMPNIIIASYDGRRNLLEEIDMGRMNVEYSDIKGGYRTMSFSGIPVLADRFAPAGTISFLNTDDFKLAQLGDWQWMENDKGNILSQLEKRPVYTATLAKYANLICKRPFAQARISGLNWK